MALPTLFHFSVNPGFFILQDAVTHIRLAALNGLVWIGAAVLVVIGIKKLNDGDFIRAFQVVDAILRKAFS